MLRIELKLKTAKPCVSLRMNAFLAGLAEEIDTEFPILACPMVANQDSTAASLPPEKKIDDCKVWDEMQRDCITI